MSEDPFLLLHFFWCVITVYEGWWYFFFLQMSCFFLLLFVIICFHNAFYCPVGWLNFYYFKICHRHSNLCFFGKKNVSVKKSHPCPTILACSFYRDINSGSIITILSSSEVEQNVLLFCIWTFYTEWQGRN